MKKAIFPCLAALLMLTSCQTQKAADDQVARVQKIMDAQFPHPADAAAASPVQFVDTPLLGGGAYKPRRGEPLPPAWANTDIVFNDASRYTLEALADALTQTWHIPTRIANAPVYDTGQAVSVEQAPADAPMTPAKMQLLTLANPGVAAKDLLAPGNVAQRNAAPRAPAVSPSLVGPLEKLLPRMEGMYDVSIYWDGTALVFDYLMVETCHLKASLFDSEISYTVSGQDGGGSGGNSGSGGGSSGGGGQGGASASTKVSAKVDAWKEISAGLEQIVPAPNKFTIYPSRGAVTFSGRRSVVLRGLEECRELNRDYGRRIAVEVAALYVDIDDQSDTGLDLQMTLNKGNVNAGTNALLPSIQSVAGTSSVGLIPAASGGRSFLAGTTAFIQAVASQDKLVDYKTGITITNSSIPGIIDLTTDQKIIQQVAVNGQTQTGLVSTSTQPTTISYGSSLQVLPRVTDDGEVLVQVNFKNSDLIALTPQTVSDVTLYLDTISRRALESGLSLRSGETLVVSGFEQMRATVNRNTAFTGYGKSVEVHNTRLILIITPTILPSNR